MKVNGKAFADRLVPSLERYLFLLLSKVLLQLCEPFNFAPAEGPIAYQEQRDQVQISFSALERLRLKD